MVEVYQNTPSVDTGYMGNIVSLCGIKSRPGFGLKVDNRLYSNTAGIQFNSIITSNPSRVWLTLRIGAASPAPIYMVLGGASPTVSTCAIHLNAGDIYQIDINNPWCGAISFENPANTGIVLEWSESSIVGL
jgi:hypothetical protein